MDSLIESLSIADIPTICRICLKKDRLVNICEGSSDKTSLQTILETVLNEKINLNDRRPKNVCTDCFTTLVQFYNFLILYQGRKSVLEKILDADNVNVSEDDAEASNSSNLDSLSAVDQSLIKLEKDPLCDFDTPQIDKLEVKEESSVKEDNKRVKRERECKNRKRKSTADQKLDKCDVCGKQYTKSYLKLHKKLYCSNPKEPPDCFNECALCGKKMLRMKMVKHFQMEHEGEKVQVKGETSVDSERYAKCDICGLQLLRPNMPRHMKLIHGKRQRENVFEDDSGKSYKKHRCDLCPNKNFSELKRLQKHIQRVHEAPGIETKAEEKANADEMDEDIVCDICGLQMSRKSLPRHNKSQHKDVDSSSFKELCQVCGMLFNKRHNLKKHYETVHEGKVYRCEQCPNKSYVSRRGLEYHIKRVHENCKPAQSNAGLVVCEICGRRTPRNNTRRLILHEMFHKFGHKFMCKMFDCQLTFADSPSRLKHMTNDHESFTCNECHKDFMDPKRFQAHCEIHIWDNNGDANYDGAICRICNQIFDNKDVLAKHLLDVHRIYWCLKTDNCFKMFVTKCSYALHCTEHRKVTEWKRFTCDICKRKFVSESVFLTHQKGHNKTEGKKCPICGYTFVKSNKLKIHMRTHTGEKPFQCSYCTKRFISAKRQKLHERYHTGEKPYQCQYCGKGFCSTTEFTRHVSLMHKKDEKLDNSSTGATENQVENERKE